MPSKDPDVVRISGRYLYLGEDRFTVRGIVYQPERRPRVINGPRDPLADECIDDLRQDVELFKDLGVNALWIYCFDPTVSHDACMSLLAAYGIYVIAHLSDNLHCIHRKNPRLSYTDEVRTHFQDVVDCLAGYANVIGACISSSLINGHAGHPDLVQEICEVFRTVTHDLKRHMQSRNVARNQRILPIGISECSWALLNTTSFEQLTSQIEADGHSHSNSSSSALDFYAFTFYSHSSPAPSSSSTNPKPNFSQIHLLSKFHNPDSPPLPLLVSEYSDSNLKRPRSFDMVTSLYTSPMLDILSGGFMYDYAEGANAYGIVKIDMESGRRWLLPDYRVFKEKLRRVRED